VRASSIGGRPAVLFSITDTGVGMTQEQCSKIFDPFTQADLTTTRKYGGTGLGLAIVSRFCKLMGGTVSVESEPAGDPALSVVLPMHVVVTEEPVALDVA
jgi:signal transduction histidine kinase